MSQPSSGRLGTAYGMYLGAMYMLERRPRPYGLVDWHMYDEPSGWRPWGSLYYLRVRDPLVLGALLASEWNRQGSRRTDILDAGLWEVHEIKPVRSADAGPRQLAGYIASLNAVAPATPWGTPRFWHGGSWDPSPYPLVIPGAGGGIWMIHAWRDPNTAGLLVYEVLSCEPQGHDEEHDRVFRPVTLSGVVQPLEALRPRLEAMLKATLPTAPAGTGYAFIVPPRFFEVFVLGPWRTEQDRLFRKAYGTQVNPVLAQRLLALWAAGNVLSGGLTDALFVSSGFMNGSELARLYGARLAATAVVGGLVLIAVVTDGAAIPVVEEVVAAGELEEAELLAEEEVETAPGDIVLPEPGPAPVEPPLYDGSGTGEAIQLGRGAIPPSVVEPPLPPGGPSAAAPMAIDPTMVGTFLIGAIPGTADAAAPVTAPAQPQAADLLSLVPITLLQPRSGVIELGAEVTYGGRKQFIIGLAGAAVAPPPGL